jgi:hypothetical protein
MMIRVKESYVSFQFVGPYYGQCSIFYYLSRAGKGIDWQEEVLKTRHKNIKHIVLLGETHNFQNHLADFMHLGKRMDIHFNINNPVIYPLYTYDTINFNVYINPLDIRNMEFIKNLIEYNNVYFVIKMPVKYSLIQKAIENIEKYAILNTVKNRTGMLTDEKELTKCTKALHTAMGYAVYKDWKVYFNPLERTDFYEDSYVYRPSR